MSLSSVKEICGTCGYGKDEIERKDSFLGEDEFQIEFCSCEKVGYKHYAAGYCGDVDDILENEPTEETNGCRTKGIAYRRFMKRVKTKRLINIIENCGYAPHIGWVAESPNVDMEGNPCGVYIKYPRNSKFQKFLKNQTSRKIRHNFDLPLKGNKYRRVVDYWWELY